MPDKQKSEEVARLEQLNEELTESLQSCRTLLQDFRAKLAANSNGGEITTLANEPREA